MVDPLPSRESLTVEFKGDRREMVSLNDIVEAAVCLANTRGGEIWLGIEDDGRPTGIHDARRNVQRLAADIESKTSPALKVVAEEVVHGGHRLVRLLVPKATSEVATTRGLSQRRRLKADGTPECVGLLPQDRLRTNTHFHGLDPSSLPVLGSTLEDLDSRERERLRVVVRLHRNSDKMLLKLDDHELDAALQFVAEDDRGSSIPTLAGLLMIGKESSIRRLVPTHEIALQILRREKIAFNEIRPLPLLHALSWLEESFKPYNDEREVQRKLFRVPIPRVEAGAFRESVANALVHRDYHRPGAVHVQLNDDEFIVGNPGGLMEGVRLDNLLVTQPKPRNRALAEALHRVGIVERSGRGVDTIYRGVLRFGRPEPDYGRTDSDEVVVSLSTTAADDAFLGWVIEAETELQATTDELPIDMLIALAAMRRERRLTAEQLAVRTQKRDTAAARRTLETLVEKGWVQGIGSTPRTRSYVLAARLYGANRIDRAAHLWQVGMDSIDHEQMVLKYIRQYGRIRRADVMTLCRLSTDQAKALLQRMRLSRRIQQSGVRGGAYYVLPIDRGA